MVLAFGPWFAVSLYVNNHDIILYSMAASGHALNLARRVHLVQEAGII